MSPGPSAAAIPPWAHCVEPAERMSLVTTMTEPTSRAWSAVVRPAIPEPMTTTSAYVVQPGRGASRRAGGVVTLGTYRAGSVSPRTSPLPGSASAGSSPVPMTRLSASTKTTLGRKVRASAVSICP